MTLLVIVLLFLAALVAGAQNAVAGGGTFLTFPTLLFAGVAPIPANATSTIALWPGGLASIGAYWGDLKTRKRVLAAFGVASLAGGLVGAELLLHTPERTFRGLIPFLIGGATLLFAFGGKLTAALRSRDPSDAPPSGGRLAALSLVQFLIAIYGGYFGAGIGILMLAALAVMGMEDIHAMNALKVVLGVTINGVAIVAFLFAGIVVWSAALVMLVGAVVGGYGGARLSKRFTQAQVRGFVIAVGAVLTIYFAATSYLVV
ncbi:MAG: sulfite exporter TauE/SafE family protein [Thermoplasmatota archaeon]